MFKQGSNCHKKVLEAAKLAYTYKTKQFITSQKTGCQYSWQITVSVLNKGKSAILPLFNGPHLLSFASDKAS